MNLQTPTPTDPIIEVEQFIDEKLPRATEALEAAIDGAAALADQPSNSPQWLEKVTFANNFIKRTKTLQKEFFDKKREAKKPFEEQAKAVETAFKPLLTSLDDLSKRADTIIISHAKVVRREHEQARKAAEEERAKEAERLRREQEEAAKRAQQANDPDSQDAERANAERLAAEAAEAARAAERAANTTIETSATVETGAGTSTVKEEITDWNVTDPVLFLHWAADQCEHGTPAFLEIAQNSVKIGKSKILSILKSGVKIPGVEPVTSIRTRVR